MNLQKPTNRNVGQAVRLFEYQHIVGCTLARLRQGISPLVFHKTTVSSNDFTSSFSVAHCTWRLDSPSISYSLRMAEALGAVGAAASFVQLTDVSIRTCLYLYSFFSSLHKAQNEFQRHVIGKFVIPRW